MNILTGNERKNSHRIFLGVSLILITLTIALTVIQTKQSQDLQSSAAPVAIKNCDIGQNKIALSATEKQALQKINAFRKDKNLPELKEQADLMRSASWMSHDQADRKKMSHTDTKGRNILVRVKDCGYTFKEINENVGEGAETGNAIFEAWKKSPEHHANMLCAACTEIGIAEEKGYWTMNAGASLTQEVPSAAPSEAADPSPEPSESEDPDDEPEPSDSPDTSSLPPALETVPDGTTGLKAMIQIPGIGAEGNQDPMHKKRELTVTVFDSTNKEVAKLTGTIQYSNDGLFRGAFALPDTIATGGYLVKVAIPYSLTETVTSGFMQIEKGKLLTLPQVILPVVDFNKSNSITITDFFLLRDCIESSCSDMKFDVNDDDAIDIIDYNVTSDVFMTTTGE